MDRKEFTGRGLSRRGSPVEDLSIPTSSDQDLSPGRGVGVSRVRFVDVDRGGRRTHKSRPTGDGTERPFPSDRRVLTSRGTT